MRLTTTQLSLQGIWQGLRVVWKVIEGSISPKSITDDIPKGWLAKRSVIRNHARGTPGKTLRIISWNILRNYNKEQIREGLADLMKNADVVFIQETPVTKDWTFWDDFKGRSVVYAPLHQAKKQSSYYYFLHTGQLIMSRHRFLHAETFALPSPTRDVFGKDHIVKRTVAYAKIGTKKRSIGLYNIHLENMSGSRGRLMQMEHVLKLIAENNDDVVVVGGDFNTIFGNELALKELEKAGFARMRIKERKLLPRIDYIFVKGATITGECVYKKGSDHYPLCAAIRV